MSAKPRKRYNQKAREKIEVTLHDSNIEVDLNVKYEKHSYDDANKLALPSKKIKPTVKRNTNKLPSKILSKKQRKLLEKVVERKKKKEDRNELLESLAKVQATPELLSRLTSISSVQTKGLKRLHETTQSSVSSSLDGVKKIKSVKGCKRQEIVKIRSRNPNVVDFQSSEDETDEDSEDDISFDNMKQLPDIHDNENKFPVIQENEKQLPDIKSEDDQNVNNPEEIVLDDDILAIDDKENNENEMENITNGKAEEEKPETKIEKIKADQKIFVPVERSPEIQRARLKLPIIGEEQVIMETINDNTVTILAGETGSGKTTQIPQFLYEAGYTSDGKMIGITEPRRVAAISMSRRVGEELNLTCDEVSYLIRFEGNAGPNTKIKFMTDGVLLKEIQQDFLLEKYSVIIIDEAHERSVYTDILIGLLSRIAPLRIKRNMPFKLIIMSATLRITDFTDNTKLFKQPPPVIKIESRQYPVSVHFNKITSIDYVKDAYKKACKIHTQLPEGGILIFLTGQQEVNSLVNKLRKTFPYEKYEKYSNSEEDDESDSEKKINYKNLKSKIRSQKKKEKDLSSVNLDNYDIQPEDDVEGDLEESDFDDDDYELFKSTSRLQPMWVLPLYSILSSNRQAKIFDKPPEGCRLCIVATNVAETSLTIPQVKYVIDSGRTKVRLYDQLTGISTFAVVWTSKASANQRAGRAGRTSAGHCYRLYSSAVFNNEFEEWTLPEIQRKPVDDLLLQMKSLQIERVVNFPFPSPPDVTQLKAAENRLMLLGALQPSSKINDDWCGKLTKLGESMAAFPVAPRFAKMLCIPQKRALLPYTIVIVAALSVQEFLLMANEKYLTLWKSWAAAGNSLLLGDVMVLLKAMCAAEFANSSSENMENFCINTGVRFKAVLEARKLRKQLTNDLNFRIPSLNVNIDPAMKPPTDKQCEQLRQIILSGMVDKVAYKLSDNELRQAGLSVNKAAYRIPEIDDIIHMNSSSILKKTKPTWVVYQEIYQYKDRLYMRGVTAIEPDWLPIYATPLCTISEPLEHPAPSYNAANGVVMCHVNATFGRSGWQLPVVEVEYPDGDDKIRWFARFLLEGKVFKKLEKYSVYLLSSPSTLLASWAKFLVKRTDVISKTLKEKNVNSKSSITKQWNSNPNYLLDEYLEWLPESSHEDVRKMWPPL